MSSTKRWLILYFTSYKLIRSLKPDQRSFCRNCSLFLNKRLQPDEEALKRHQQASPAHEVIDEISDAMLNEPVRYILKPVEVNSFNAVSLLVSCSNL